MDAMTVTRGFTEYEKGKRVRREKGDEITVSVERAAQLRERGLARSKPKAAAEKAAPKPDPETAKAD